jgi:uncharacterized membrane protein YtjA (UPF0391 family)
MGRLQQGKCRLGLLKRGSKVNGTTVAITVLAAPRGVVEIKPRRRQRRVARAGRGCSKEIVMLTTLGLAALLGQTLGGLVWLAIVFFIIALIAYVLGARGVAGMSAGIGRTLLFVFLVLAIIFLIVGLVSGPRV